MSNHLTYIPSNGTRDSNIKLCKNMKSNVLYAFCGCGDMIFVLLEPIELQHLQGSVESEELICLGS